MRPDEQTPHATINGSSPHGHANGSAAKSSDTNGYHSTSNGNGGQDTPPPGQNTSPYFGHDREEVTRIIMQGLSDLGYEGVASQLQATSGYKLEVPRVASFRQAVLEGRWHEAESMLFGKHSAGSGQDGIIGEGDDGMDVSGLPLADEADPSTMRFLLRERKYLELLEKGSIDAALNVLRDEITPLKRDITRLHLLSR